MITTIASALLCAITAARQAPDVPRDLRVCVDIAEAAYEHGVDPRSTGAVRLASVLRGVTTRLAQADHVHDPDVRFGEALDRFLVGEGEIEAERRVRDQQDRDARRERRRDRAVRVLRAIGATALGIALSRREGADL